MHQATDQQPEVNEAAEAARLNTSGIYSITNTVTGKKYIGSAVNLANRETYHRWQLRKSEHHSQKLQRAWNKYGEAAFVFQPLLICAPKDLLMYEQIVLDYQGSVRDGYNVLPTAGSALGMKHSAETRAKISAAHTGMKRSEKVRAEMSKRMTGSVRSAETKAKIAAASKTRELPAAFIAQMGKREIPEATRQKISAKLMGHAVSAESRAKMSASQKALPPRKHTEETKKKMSILAKERCARKAAQRLETT